MESNLTFLCFQVRELVSECQCPTQFPMIRVSEGKYRIGDTQVLIFVRVCSYYDIEIGFRYHVFYFLLRVAMNILIIKYSFYRY